MFSEMYHTADYTYLMISEVEIRPRWCGRVISYVCMKSSDCIYNLLLILRLVLQLEKVSTCGYCGFLPLRGHFMAHQALSAAEPSMRSLTPSSLFLCFPGLLATPPPPRSSFACALLTRSPSEKLCILAKSIWFGWGQTGWIWRVLLCDPGSASCPLHWRVEGGLPWLLSKLLSLNSGRHLIVFFKTFVKVEHSQSSFKESQFTWRPSWQHLQAALF